MPHSKNSHIINTTNYKFIMKKLLICHFTCIALATILFISCKTTEEPKQEQLQLPVLKTKAATEITATSATGGGNITANDGSNIITSGICWSLKSTPTLSDSITKGYTYMGEYTGSLRNLLSDTTYYVRAYATNYDGTAYGNQITFRTLKPTIPTVKTTLSTIYNTSAKIEATVTSSSGLSILSKGFCWSETSGPTLSDKTTEVTVSDFKSEISNLKSGSAYYVRAYAKSSVGIGYGNELKITTTIADLDGNTYHAVTIGTQTWMVENLKTKKYQDGTIIPNVTTDAWTSLTTGAWCDFTNSASNGLKYGHLYNWYAVNNGKNNLAPLGWHIPTNDEWTTLTDYLGGLSVAGGKLKEVGTANWKSPNTGATNETGFTAMAGGWTYLLYFNMGADGAWWTSTEVSLNSDKAWSKFMYYNYNYVENVDMSKNFGFSVRCVRDN